MLQTRAYENHVYYIFTNAHQTLFISEEGAIEAMGSEGTVTYHSGDSSFRRRGPESKTPPWGLAGCFFALGSGLGLVGTASSRR